jgi:hypothetical protein
MLKDETQRNLNEQQMLAHARKSSKPSVKTQSTAKLIFEQCSLYRERPCKTCNIPRKPRASHCKVCNNCVKGYDHHCTLLNNCVGDRNLRAFISLLLSSWIFFLQGMVYGLCALAYDQLML